MMKDKNNVQLYKQVVLVFCAFLITVISSLFAIVNVMNKLLGTSTEKNLAMIEVNINNTVSNIDMIFGNTFHYVNRRINNGENNQQILLTLTNITEWLSSIKSGAMFENGLYGFIHGEYLDGSGWVPPDDYVPTERPWYINAQNANGRAVVAEPYIDAFSGRVITGISQAIFDKDNNYVGVISIDAYLDELFEYIRGLRFEDGGYIILLDRDYGIVTHPNMSFLGKNYMEVNPRLIPLLDRMRKNNKILVAQNVINSEEEKVIVSIKEMDNGWILINAVLEKNFYAVVYNVALILGVIGLIGFALTAYILYRINKQREVAVEANIGKTAFLARMSHELRTPLNAINGFAEIELRKKHNGETQGNILKILSSGNTLIGIINDILDVSKIESGKLELLSAEYDFATVVRDVMNMNMVKTVGKNISLNLKMDDNIPARFLGDEIRVKQTINNVLSNAIKYTDKGEVSISFSAVPVSDNQCELVIGVKDTGIGISEENIDKLFGEYLRFDVDKHRSIEGTGLGLHITKKLAEKMGGDIFVESEYGKGSHFKINIKQIVIGNDFISKETIEKLQNFDFARNNTDIINKLHFVSLPHVNALIVDDVRVNLDVAVGIMSPYEMKIDTLLSGEEALKLIGNGCEKYDILFIDHMMPGMDGIECVSRIRQINSQYAKNVPIIALTANAVVGMEETFLKAGFSGFISKPINTIKLDEIIHKFICTNNPLVKNKLLPKTQQHKKFPEIDGIDLEGGVKKFNGDSNIYLRVLNSFVKNTPSKLLEIDNPTALNLSDYALVVHGIKGSCYGINANFSGDKAAILEKLANENNIAEIQKLNPQFLKTVEKLIDDLKKFITQENSAKPIKTKAAKPDTELLRAILSASQNYDSEEMHKIVGELDKFDYENGNDLISQIKRGTSEFDYETVIKTVKNYLEA